MLTTIDTGGRLSRFSATNSGRGRAVTLVGKGVSAPARDVYVSVLRDHLDIVRRRKWLVLEAAVLVPVAVVIFSLQQHTVYRGSIQLLVSPADFSVAREQAVVARSPTVVARALADAGAVGMTGRSFLARSSVSADARPGLLTFQVRAGTAAFARQLVHAYGWAYIGYRFPSNKLAVRSLGALERRLRSIRDRQTSSYANLVARRDMLVTRVTLRATAATVVRPASAAKIEPRPVRNGVIGLILGVVLGVGLALVWEAGGLRTGDGGTKLVPFLLIRLRSPAARRVSAPGQQP